MYPLAGLRNLTQEAEKRNVDHQSVNRLVNKRIKLEGIFTPFDYNFCRIQMTLEEMEKKTNRFQFILNGLCQHIKFKFTGTYFMPKQSWAESKDN